jgi:hypothetical protein
LGAEQATQRFEPKLHLREDDASDRGRARQHALGSAINSNNGQEGLSQMSNRQSVRRKPGWQLEREDVTGEGTAADQMTTHFMVAVSMSSSDWPSIPIVASSALSSGREKKQRTAEFELSGKLKQESCGG